MPHRHIGRISNTDQRCVVVFMQLPDRPTHALICPTSSLPPRLEQNVMEVLESNEGQNDECLANVLSRRLMPDTGMTVLEALHRGDHLHAMPVANIVMLPMPNMPFPLDQVLANQGKLPGIDGEPAPEQMQRFNPHLHNRDAISVEDRTKIARNLLVEADLIGSEAQKKREAAYSYAPELRPVVASTKAAPAKAAEPADEKPKAKRPAKKDA